MTARRTTSTEPPPDGDWVLLLHRLPREPSAPRIALWRAIRRLGAVLLGDGLVALPADDRSVEHLEWLAAAIQEQGGAASTWIARPTTRVTSAHLAEQARASVEAEYRAVMREVAAQPAALSDADRRRVVRRLRSELRRIDARDYFEAPSSGAARAAVDGLAQDLQPTSARERGTGSVSGSRPRSQRVPIR